MDAGEFVPSGQSVPGPVDGRPGFWETRDAPRRRDGLILPVVFAVAAWAVDWFTRSALGDWRYVPVAFLGLCALYFSVVGVVFAAAIGVAKSDGREAPRWRARTANVLFMAVVAAAFIVACVQAVRDHSFIDAGNALVIAVWVLFVPWSPTSAASPRYRKVGYRLATCLLPVWVLAIYVFRLR